MRRDPSGMRRLVFSAFLLFVGVIVGVVLVTEFNSVPNGRATGGLVEQEKEVLAPPPARETIDTRGTRGDQTFVAVSKAVTPAVVNIAATRNGGGEGDSRFPFQDPLFKRFFGDDFFRSPDKPKRRKSEGLGSGVIIEPDGLIVTNYHVIENADEIVVLLADKREFSGEIVGTDPKSDLALIRIKGDNLPTIPWGDSSKLQVGEYVLAIGSPFGFTQTVTMGIVSAIGRADIGLANYEDFIQTDAAINPGNSGGAMVNVQGELVGINTAIFTRSGGYMGIGFAVPSNMAQSVVQSLAEKGEVVRGWLGVAIQEVTAALAQGFGLEEAKGVLISEVMSGSPAEKAGFSRGDVIVAFGDMTITDTNQLRNVVADTGVGEQVPVRIIRNKKALVLEVLIEAQPKDLFVRKQSEIQRERSSTQLGGVAVRNLNEALARQFGLDENARGVVVVSVEPESPASEAGIKGGDLIMEVNRIPVHDIEAYETRLGEAPAGEPILLLIGRKNRTLFLTVTPQ